MEAMEILKCPKTGNKLRFDDANSVVVVEDSAITYPMVDGIVDFCPEARDIISKSYDGCASLYDTYITSSSVFMKLCNRFVWRTGDYSEFMGTVLSYLPSQFDGVLLDVPVGTGVFTDSLYANFPNATIIAIDYSMGMLQKAKDRFEQQGLANICLVRADVANLPLVDSAADIVLSMNGLHAFPDKQRAIAEMRRSLRPGGSLVASSYIKGDSMLGDWIIKHCYARIGFFSPPFFTIDDIGSYLEGFNIIKQGNTKSGICFEAVKVV
jgi:ubiquinone/menaquinone biosynthesis C-methylase UbiE/uncharacterized protein YbaR (Trm112 family)